MEIKQNEATLNRPEGSRIIDAPWVFTNLDALAKQLRSENAWKKNDRNGITVIKTDRLTVVLTAMKSGAEIKDNLVDGFFMLQVLKGKVLLETDACTFKLKAGSMLNLHPKISHTITASEESILLLVTYL